MGRTDNNEKYNPEDSKELDKKPNSLNDGTTGENKVAPEEEVKVVNPTRKLMKYMRKELPLFVVGSIALLGGSVGELVNPIYIGMFVDNLNEKQYDRVYTLCWQLALIVVGQSVCVFVRGYLYNLISERIAKNLRGDLYSSLINKDVEFFDSKKTGDLLSRIGADIAVVQDGLSTNVSMFVRSFIFIIVAFIFVFIISWQLTLVIIGCIVPVLIFSVFFGKAMKSIQKAIQDGKALISTVAEETFSNVRTVKAFATEADEVRRFELGNVEIYEYGKLKTLWYAFFQFITSLFVFGAMAAIFAIGTSLVKEGLLTIGQITAFMFYLLQILINFMILAQVLGAAMSIVGASYKIVELLEYEPKINTSGGIIPGEAGAPKTDGKGEISLRDIRFNYPTKKDVTVLKGVSIDIQKNKVIALVGPSGCGKSSIISMIERFYDPNSGQVLFDGIDIKTLNPRWYHQQIGIVSQEPVLFSGSIRENIGYGLENVTDQMLDEACQMANAYTFIYDKELFPDGYSTIVGERGVKLSGGQKQRIAIARALIRKPKILLLDEATSALDAESEHQVQMALDILIKAGQQTIIVIAHRLSTIRDANEIIVIKKGEIAERGTHEDLIKNGNGVYKKLVERQMMKTNFADEAD